MFKYVPAALLLVSDRDPFFLYSSEKQHLLAIKTNVKLSFKLKFIEMELGDAFDN